MPTDIYKRANKWWQQQQQQKRIREREGFFMGYQMFYMLSYLKSGVCVHTYMCVSVVL